MKTPVRIACACCCLVALCSGCLFNSREVRVSGVDSPAAQRDYYRNELINYDGLAQESENFLRGNLLMDELGRRPVLILARINEYFNVSGNPKYLLIAADVCRYLATQVDEEESIRYHLSSYYYSTSYMRFVRKKSRESSPEASQGFSYDVTSAQAFNTFNEACSGIFTYLKNRNILDASSVQLKDLEGRSFVMDKPEYRLSVPREAIEDFSLCASYDVKNLMQFNRIPGAGVPLVASVREKQWCSSLKTPSGLTIPVTVSIHRVDNEADRTISLRLMFVDTLQRESFNEVIGDSSRVNIPIALDFSTPLACFLDRAPERNLLSLMLDSNAGESSAGLYMVEPYQPNKIPVVFIHGLMSSPETWVQMINSLKNDPTIRRRYQFWFFSYSTGSPVLASAKILRESLLAAQKEFCTTPEATANFNRMVLVGHSMGGLMTRLMVQKNPYYFFETFYRMPWSQIESKLKPDDLRFLDAFVPYSLPFVHRVVFMAVPHRGANMAQSPLAWLGSYLIKLPNVFLSAETDIDRINGTLMPNYAEVKAKLANRFYTGIDNLDPDGPFSRVCGSSQMKDDLIYHSIIGNAERAESPGGSDGIVPYWSSHLDGAASERIVKSDHSVHRRPAAIQELLRILLLHQNSLQPVGFARPSQN